MFIVFNSQSYFFKIFPNPFFLPILSFPIVASSPITNNLSLKCLFKSSIKFSAVKTFIVLSKSIEIISFIPNSLINFSFVLMS